MPDLVLNVLAFFAVLLVLVLVHELGHFVTAKLAGVDVQEFGFGYPPKLFGVHFKGTEYTFNLLPLGGFVKMLGEEDPKQTGSFAGKSIPARLIILAAGSGMNALLPILLISGSLMLPREVATGPVVIQQVMNASPAERAGLLPGDTIVRINDRSVASIRDVGFNIHLNLGSPLEMEVERGGSPHVLHMTPRWHPPAGQGATGIVIGMPDGQIKTVSRSLPDAFGGGVRQSLDMITLFKNGIISTFGSGGGGGGAAIAGPIGIAQVTGEVAKAGVPSLLEWAAFLSMNLAVVNILPIPALDGGRIVFVLLEWVRRGRRISPEREGLVHLAGMAVLLGIIAVVSGNDILRIINGESIIP